MIENIKRKVKKYIYGTSEILLFDKIELSNSTRKGTVKLGSVELSMHPRRIPFRARKLCNSLIFSIRISYLNYNSNLNFKNFGILQSNHLKNNNNFIIQR